MHPGVRPFQIRRDFLFCGTSGYIYWKSGRGAPVGARAGLGPTPTKETKPYRVYCKERSQNGASCVEGPLIRLGFAVPPFPIPSGLRPSPLDKGSRPPRGKVRQAARCAAPTDLIRLAFARYLPLKEKA